MGRGQWFGLAIGVSGLLVAGFCAYVGQPWPASVIGGATLVGLVTAFLRHEGKEK